MKTPPDHSDHWLREHPDQLLNLYESSTEELPPAEEQSLLPILNSLDTSYERYEELGFIAQGGEKRITRVYDHRLNRQVVVARAVNAKTKQDQEKFLREARLVANLAHPNIPPIHNMGFDHDGTPFFSMELIPGDNLGEIIKNLHKGDETYRKKYPLDTLLNLYLKVCDAIAYAHSRNVLHLDIKPDNIRIGPFGEVFVCDWGLAIVLFEENLDEPDALGELDGDVLNDVTLSGTIKGTPGFMAPEQTVPDGAKTFQTDIYSLGALLYSLLSYISPVQGNSANEIVKKTRTGKTTPLQTHAKGKNIPKSLAAVTHKALALRPKDRYRSVVELQQEITRYITGFPTFTEQPRTMTRFSLLVRRHNQVASLAMVFLVMLATIISFTLMVIAKKNASETVARKQAEKNFQLYRIQQAEAQNLYDDLSKATRFAISLKHYSQAHQILRALEIGLEKNPDPARHTTILLQKGTIHFLLEQFNQAIQCFDDAKGGTIATEQWHRLSKKYAALKPRDSDMLSPAQFIELLHEKGVQGSVILYVYFHHMRRMPHCTPEEYLPIAKAVLDRLHSPWKKPPASSILLKKTASGYHLDLTHSPYVIYTLGSIGMKKYNVLTPLHLDSLDISHLPLTSLDELTGLHLRELKMVGLHIEKPFMMTKQLRDLKPDRLIIDTHAYPEKVITLLEQTCEVVDDPNTEPANATEEVGKFK